MKKIVLFLCALWLTSASLWAYDFEVDGICFSITDETNKYVSVAGSSTYSGDVVIPARVTYNETSYSVTSIAGSAFRNCTGLTSVAIPESIISIGSNAFYGCTGLTSVTIPNSVTSIADNTFYNCTDLTEVSLSNRMTTIPSGMFSGCQQLAAISIPERVTSIGTAAFNDCISLTSLTIPNSITEIGNGAFYDCSGLTEVSLSNQITNIPTNAFLGCWRLTSITIPNSVYTIGQWAFNGCTGLTSVTIGKRVNNIASRSLYGAFVNCHSLKEFIVHDENETFSSVDGLLCNKAGTTLITYPNCKSPNYTLPGSITAIADYAFCGEFTNFSLTIPNSVTKIGSYAFCNCEGLTSIIIGDNVTEIGSNVFQGCTHLKEFVLGSCLQSIPSYAFLGCQSLTSITIPNSVTSINSNAFKDCIGLKEVIISDGVITIGNSAFLGCTRLATVSIGSSVTAIENLAFSDCENLKAIYCQSYTPPTIQKNSFDQIALNTVDLFVPTGSLSAYEGADVWWQFLNKKELVAGKSVLTLSVNDDTMGTVTGGGEYDNGAVVTIKAEYNKGYRFVQWNDGSTENPREIVMTGDTAFIAEFGEISYNSNGIALTTCGTDWGNAAFGSRKLLILALSAGNDTTQIKITSSNPNHIIYHDYIDQVFTAEKGSTIHMKVNSDNSMIWMHGYMYIDCNNDGNFAVDINTENGLVNAGSELLSYSYYGINDDSEEQGFNSTGEAQIGRNSNRSVLGEDAMPSFTLPDLAIGNYRMRFKIDWNCLDPCGNDAPNQLMTENEGYIVDFTLAVVDSSTTAKLDLVSNNIQWGTVARSGVYKKEDTVTIEAIPAEGYQFVRWSDGVTENPRSLYLIQDLSLTAEFAAIPCQLIVQSNNDVMGRVTGSGSYEKETEVTIEAISTEGYDFVRWSDGSYENPRTITITHDTIFTALFQEQYHELSLFVNNEALGSVTLNRVAIIEAIPAEGATFVGWSDGNTENPRMVYLNQDISLTAQFSVITNIEGVDGIMIKIYAVDGAICIDDAPAGETITVNDLSGRTVKVEETTEGITRIILEESGIYLVRVGNCTAKVIL